LRVLTHHSGLENEWRNNVRISGKVAGFNTKKLSENNRCSSWDSGFGEQFWVQFDRFIYGYRGII
jgi:hypothetical protein